VKSYRLNRLFNAHSGNCFDVALDHGFFGESTFLPGIENIERAVQVLAEASPDAIQLSVGQARHLQGIRGKEKPALVLRTDIANVYGSNLPRALFSKMIERPVEQALQLDAACVVVNLFSIPGQPEVTAQCVDNILRIKPEADRYAMPLMIEPLVFQPNEQARGYMVDGDVKKIVPLVRQAVELGADIIKADPTSDPSQYPRVIEVAGSIPVLVRGGGRVSDREIMTRTHALMRTGARGIVYGRNVIQHPSPNAITRALMAVVHKDASVEDALKYLEPP
jgi:class I fructose-bisphosphate aldolase